MKFVKQSRYIGTKLGKPQLIDFKPGRVARFKNTQLEHTVAKTAAPPRFKRSAIVKARQNLIETGVFGTHGPRTNKEH